VYIGRIAALRRPGYPLQFLGFGSRSLRDFRFYPLRVLAMRNLYNKTRHSAYLIKKPGGFRERESRRAWF
jgi:hypothetical protein